MNPACLLNRFVGVKKTILTVNSKLIQKAYWSSKSSRSDNTSSSSSSNNSSSDDAKKNQRKKKSEEALNKLNLLLKSMIEEDAAGISKPKLNLAKPVNKRKKENDEIKVESVKEEPPEIKMVHAVKGVAETIGGDTKQTESELLLKLLSTSESGATSNLSDIVKGMTVVHEDAPGQSRAQQVKQILQYAQETKSSDISRPRPRFPRVRSEIPAEKIDLFGSEPLGIFTDLPEDASEGVQNKTWNKLYERDLKLAVTHPPTNYFQQLILWTEQGKIWKFPIDNEQGLEEEKKVYFAEHVFLEQYLEPWCPQKGPLRHFMELVCVGLSKNPYITVETKKEHIEWYKNYFEEKKQLLTEVGALQGTELDKGSSTSSSPKQIE